METIAVIGLGYVGLPVALAFAREHTDVIGFDIDETRIEELRKGNDRTREVTPEALRNNRLELTADAKRLDRASFFVVTVPTPIDDNRCPDLTPLQKACGTIGTVMKKGSVVVFESTVYPGVTEEFCGPELARVSGLRQGIDFKLGYSPERINPGDKAHSFENIMKIVAAEDQDSLDRVVRAYGPVVRAGLHQAPTIKVAEAAKVIENVQRDLNIALMNELAIIFERMNISTKDVLDAAGTKWNFMPFKPGLVGGHCIGVDPYYLTAKAEALGYHPEVILAGRRINDSMGSHVAQRVIKMLIQADRQVKGARVAIIGLTFKEDVPDLRNTRVPDIAAELAQFGIEAVIADPEASPQEARHEYGIALTGLEDLGRLDAMILAVPHKSVMARADALIKGIQGGGVLFDVKSALDRARLPESIHYGSL